LCDYFDRNHRFRVGAYEELPFRVGSIAYPGTDFNAGNHAREYSEASSLFEPPLVTENATLLDYVNWFKQPAVLRFIMAHSNPWNSAFGDSYITTDLETTAGGRPFRWQHSGNEYRPSLQEQGGAADLYLHRTLWQNRALSGTGPSLIIHGGCEVMSPAGTHDVPYYNPSYASFQNAEGILFYMNGLALMARAKVFFDTPRGFAGVFKFSPRANFGDGWKAYFDIEANDPALSSFSQAVNSKKAYFWSLIGDWTTRLRYENGIGILGISDGAVPAFKSLYVHANDSWIDNWNFVTRDNMIAGIGDIDGDKISEFVTTSAWGIGILKHDGNRWKQVIVAPNDTWFGGWRYNASVNIGTDRIRGIGKFTTDSSQQILIISSWGIGVLGMLENALTSIVLQPNGTRFGGWLFDSRANQIIGFGDMNGDGLDEVLITSAWGIGILVAAGNTFRSLMVSPNDTWFGGWRYNSLNDTIHSISDFDGDGRAEILITSAWGLGILKLEENHLISIATYSNGTDLNGYILNTRTSRIVADGNFEGDVRSLIALADDTGIHILKLDHDNLRQTANLRNGERAGEWLLNTADNNFGPVGDFDGDGRAEFIVRSPWGLAILGLEGDIFRCLAIHRYGTLIGDWTIEHTDHIVGVGNFGGSEIKKELFFQK
jgi:hypothetical protein